jgi:uncharacterized protein
MKHTLCITLRCNLACSYCYIEKRPSLLSLSTARRVVDFIFSRSLTQETINIGFFGGEPLLEFDLLKSVTKIIEDHPSYEPHRVKLAVVTNGTVFSEEIAEFLLKHNITYCVSCDGPPATHDISRRFADGNGTSAIVARTIVQAVETFPVVLVNAVYRPGTLTSLPDTVDYLASLGVRQIYLNPDFSASWGLREIELLPAIYEAVANRYMAFYRRGQPRFVSLIDSKIAVMLRGGYHPQERCRMGEAEFAYTPEGHIYPCERLIGAGAGNGHCIGNVRDGLEQQRMCSHVRGEGGLNTECGSCGVQDYCMNWCGCSNYFMTGFYNRVGPFLCASEKSALQVALQVFQTLEHELGPTFLEHLGGAPNLNSLVQLKRS